MRLETKSVALATGVTLPYLDMGHAAGCPIVLIHGLTDSHWSFAPLLERLPRSHRLLVPTMRGHGDATKPDAGYAPAYMAADVAAFLDALGIDRAIIVGHSMGSIVAPVLVETVPQRVLGLALLGAFATLHDNQPVRDVLADVETLADDIPDDFARAWQQGSLAAPVPDTFFETVIRETRKVPTRVFRAALHGLTARDHTSTGTALAVPTLIIWGDQDAFCSRADQDALVDVLPHARLLIYRRAGHAMHWEEPARVAADIAAWAMSATETLGMATG